MIYFYKLQPLSGKAAVYSARVGDTAHCNPTKARHSERLRCYEFHPRPAIRLLGVSLKPVWGRCCLRIAP